MMVNMTVLPDHADTQWMAAWSHQEGARRANASLLAAFGVEAKSTWSAPGRVMLAGEYTDISNGTSIATITPHRTYIAAAKRSDSSVRITTDRPSLLGGPSPVWHGDLGSLDHLRDEAPWISYPAGVLWALQERGYSGCGLDLAIISCVPAGCGLSSDTSFAAATAIAVNELWGLSLPTGVAATDLAEVCIDAENDVVGGATAGVGSHVILRCLDGEAIYLDFNSRPPTAISFPLTFEEYGLGLLIIDTGVRSARVVAIVRARMQDAVQAEKALGVSKLRELHSAPGGLARIEALADPDLRKRARHIFTENERVDLVRDELTGTAPAHERFVSVGKAMYRSHASLELNFDVSCDELNLAVDTAFRVGALGARLIGAGDGGSAIALIRRSQAVGAAQAIDSAFQERGLTRPTFAFF